MSGPADEDTETTSEESAEESRGGFRFWMLIPALGAAMVLAVFMLGLERENPKALPSPLINHLVPEFTLAGLREGEPGFSSADLKAPGVKLVNVWASWCAPCRAEHPQLMELAGRNIPIYGINYKDKKANALAFLEEMGNPFHRLGVDDTGRTSIDFGVYGVPETFVVDGKGRIVYKHIGPILQKDIEGSILPAIEKAQAGG